MTLDRPPKFIAAGAWAVGTGSNLTPKDVIANKDWSGLTAIAKEFVDAVKVARAS